MSATTASGFDPVPADRAAVLDPRWLEQALDLVDDGDRVVAVDEVGSSKTVADKLRFVVTIEGPSGTRTHPLCAKAHFGDGINSLLGEASFYRHLQPWLGVRSPSAHHTGVDPATNRGLIVMDDIVALGGTIGDAHAPYPVDVCRDALGQLALLHARTWGDDRWDHAWLAPRVATMASMFPTGYLQELLDDGRGPDLPPVLRDASGPGGRHGTHRRASPHLRPSRRHAFGQLLRRQRRPGLLVRLADRAARPLVGRRRVSPRNRVDRRGPAGPRGRAARALPRRARGPRRPAPAFDEAWERYTLGFTWGYFLWVITRISSREVVLLHVPRLGAALTDHDTFARLGV